MDFSEVLFTQCMFAEASNAPFLLIVHLCVVSLDLNWSLTQTIKYTSYKDPMENESQYHDKMDDF